MRKEGLVTISLFFVVLLGASLVSAGLFDYAPFKNQAGITGRVITGNAISGAPAASCDACVSAANSYYWCDGQCHSITMENPPQNYCSSETAIFVADRYTKCPSASPGPGTAEPGQISTCHTGTFTLRNGDINVRGGEFDYTLYVYDLNKDTCDWDTNLIGRFPLAAYIRYQYLGSATGQKVWSSNIISGDNVDNVPKDTNPVTGTYSFDYNFPYFSAVCGIEVTFGFAGGDTATAFYGVSGNCVCDPGAWKCSGQTYYTCSNIGKWVSQGNVDGQCGYVDPTTLKNCADCINEPNSDYKWCSAGNDPSLGECIVSSSACGLVRAEITSSGNCPTGDDGCVSGVDTMCGSNQVYFTCVGGKY